MNAEFDAVGRSRITVWMLFLAGPVIWFTHFMVVYLIGEAACTADGAPTRTVGSEPVSWFTLIATAIAGTAAFVLAAVAFRRWRAHRDPAWSGIDGDESNVGLALAGALLGVVFVVAILFVGLPAAFLDPC